MPVICPQAASLENPVSSWSTETLACLLLQDICRVGSLGAPELGPFVAGAQAAEPSLCSRGTQVGRWSVRRTVWLTCMASSAGVTAVGGSTSQESIPVWPIM